MKMPIDYIRELVEEKGKEIIINGIQDYLIDFVSVFPILTAVAFGTYICFSMVSKTLAKVGVIGVFFYGAIVVMFI